MASTVDVIDDYRALLVKVGLGEPLSRALAVGALTAGVTYLAKFPNEAFRDDGSVKPLKYLSPEPDATYTHFLLLPVVIATATYLFT